MEFPTITNQSLSKMWQSLLKTISNIEFQNPKNSSILILLLSAERNENGHFLILKLLLAPCFHSTSEYLFFVTYVSHWGLNPDALPPSYIPRSFYFLFQDGASSNYPTSDSQVAGVISVWGHAQLLYFSFLCLFFNSTLVPLFPEYLIN